VAVDIADKAQLEWFERTAHCGMCGNPGDYCTCLRPCGCADMHQWGSARAPDALGQFREVTLLDQPMF